MQKKVRRNFWRINKYTTILKEASTLTPWRDTHSDAQKISWVFINRDHSLPDISNYKNVFVSSQSAI